MNPPILSLLYHPNGKIISRKELLTLFNCFYIISFWTLIKCYNFAHLFKVLLDLGTLFSFVVAWRAIALCTLFVLVLSLRCFIFQLCTLFRFCSCLFNKYSFFIKVDAPFVFIKSKSFKSIRVSAAKLSSYVQPLCASCAERRKW